MDDLWPADTEVEFKVNKNGTLFQTLTAKWEDFGAGLEIDTSSSDGTMTDTYQVDARLLVKGTTDTGFVFKSNTATMVPDITGDIVADPSKPALIADANDMLDLEVTLEDGFGNAVPNGTPVELLHDNALGDTNEDAPPPTLTALTSSGTATFQVKAPYAEDIDLIVRSAGHSEPVKGGVYRTLGGPRVPPAHHP